MQLAIADSYDIPGVQLPAATRLYLSVDPHPLCREKTFDFSPAVNHSRELKQLPEPDHLAANVNLVHPQKATGRLAPGAIPSHGTPPRRFASIGSWNAGSWSSRSRYPDGEYRVPGLRDGRVRLPGSSQRSSGSEAGTGHRLARRQ
jgi:hypothetical protein